MEEKNESKNFIEEIIDEHNRTNKYGGKVVTRFPPEPNGYLHIGHAKSICLNFGIAKKYGGKCHLRFDDTNPVKEDIEYIESIKEDVKWLGFDWGENLFFASDYFDQLYEYAIQLIKKGKAYVCQLSPDKIREYRGTLTEPGKDSPYRNRSVEENLELFEKMRRGEFEEGEAILRAKIDMSSPNINMRDPAIYRIKKVAHHRTGNKWCIYPMYDFAHCISDSIEKITHSICTLEFEDHRPLYDWFLDELGIYHPQQIEFARLNLTYTVMSKRKLLELVKEKIVSGWDDPRMPTLSGLRRRGYTPEAIRQFCDAIGVAKSNSMVDISHLEHCLREDLNKRAQRVMAVLEPIKIIIENYPDNQIEEIEILNNPEDETMGKRKIHFTKIIYIEKDDFREVPPPKYFRLYPGNEVRLMNAYYIKCKEIIKDKVTGEIKEIICTYDPETKGGWSKDGRKVKGTIHWISDIDAVNAEVRLYDHLFTIPNLDDIPEDKDYKDYLNPNSLIVLKNCKVENRLQNAAIGDKFQFLRLGYFCIDKDSTPENLIINRTVPLKDSWAKIEKKLSK
ncbi:MAG TPA: glutamine--tRNA ligase/YqeY domain fusion protein [bacterium]|nr:glutamine--tRNA ligase/YqeY domain fusion protein [bacterium]HOL47562.1 glutamine--tRNA ligase/YqeY domain fusion protein [bacterium]HPQ18454.1 glutamine--tRNA ligase/YqeY domain fusion protein [bacterium]